MSGGAAAPRRPRILLVAGDVRDAWAGALASEFEVVTTGWLDGITAARLQRPDLVLVSADLPPDAPRLVLTAFRSDPRLAAVPVVIARVDPTPPEPLWGNPVFLADRYLPATVDAARLVPEVREAVRAGRVEFRRTRAQKVALALLLVGVVALAIRAFGNGIEDLRGEPPRAGHVGAALIALGAAALAAAAAVAIVSFNRRPTHRELRTALGWAGLFLPQLQSCVGREHPAGTFGAVSLALLAWAGWAWMGPRVKPRTPRARRGWYLLAALLALLAAGPWIAWAWIRSGR